MLIVHKSFNNIAPIYVSELLKVYTPSRSRNMLLKEPTSKRTWGDTCRSFSVAGSETLESSSNWTQILSQ